MGVAVYVDAGGLERGCGEEEGFEVAEGRREEEGPWVSRRGRECRRKGLRGVVCVCEWVLELGPRGDSRRRR